MLCDIILCNDNARVSVLKYCQTGLKLMLALLTAMAKQEEEEEEKEAGDCCTRDTHHRLETSITSDSGESRTLALPSTARLTTHSPPQPPVTMTSLHRPATSSCQSDMPTRSRVRPTTACLVRRWLLASVDCEASLMLVVVVVHARVHGREPGE